MSDRLGKVTSVVRQRIRVERHPVNAVTEARRSSADSSRAYLRDAALRWIGRSVQLERNTVIVDHIRSIAPMSVR